MARPPQIFAASRTAAPAAGVSHRGESAACWWSTRSALTGGAATPGSATCRPRWATTRPPSPRSGPGVRRHGAHGDPPAAVPAAQPCRRAGAPAGAGPDLGRRGQRGQPAGGVAGAPARRGHARGLGGGRRARRRQRGQHLLARQRRRRRARSPTTWTRSPTRWRSCRTATGSTTTFRTSPAAPGSTSTSAAACCPRVTPPTTAPACTTSAPNWSRRSPAPRERTRTWVEADAAGVVRERPLGARLLA